MQPNKHKTCYLRKERLCLFLFFAFFSISATFAQTVSGVIKGADGETIIGATVQIKGTDIGTVTDVNGVYSIQASPGQELIFSMIGTETQNVTVGTSNTIDVVLQGSVLIDEVVIIGALGIVQDKRKLVYGAQGVSGLELKNTQRDNAFQSLQGRISGMTLTPTSGLAGGSVSINLRGVTSIGNSNQPLIVMDGLPINSGTFNQHTLTSDANAVNANINNNRDDVGSRLAEINPNDIESITVLKGPEAAALYGNEGANGVIIITTKKGKAGTGKVTYSNRFTTSKITRFPEVQTTYGRGVNGAESLNDADYFGPAYPAGTTFYDNLGNFFQRGNNMRHDIALEGGSERITYRLSGAYVDSKGNIPTNTYNQTNLALSSDFKVTSWLKGSSRFSTTQNNNVMPPGGSQGYLTGTLRYPANYDMREYVDEAGIRTLTLPSANFGNDNENSFFNVYKNARTEKTTRNTANVTLTADLAPWWNITGRFGADTYNTGANRFFHPESNIGFGRAGWIENYIDVGKILNTTIFTTFNKKFGDFSTNFIVGTSVDDRRNEVSTDYGEKFYLPEFNSINNTEPTTQRNRTTLTRTRLVGIFGKAEFNYKEFLILSLTGRNDNSSTLPKENNSYFYPSAGLAFNFTELPALKGKTGPLSFGKIRASFANVGNPAPPYKITSRLVSQTSTGGGFLFDFFGDNPALKPESVKSIEIGTELGLWNDRVILDLSYYNKSITDQIVTQRLSYGTGFIFGLLNGGDVQTNGIDGSLDINIFQKQNFRWNVITNFTKYKTAVANLPAQVSEYYDSDTWAIGNARASAFAPADVLASRFTSASNLFYEPINGRGAGTATAIGGWSYLRNSKGDVLIDPATGFPLRNANFLPIGDRNPDFVIGLVNDFKIKNNLSISFLLDIRKGGDIFNGNELYLYQTGLSKRTLDREQPLTIKGVLKDGMEESETPTVNTKSFIPIDNEQYFSVSVQPEDFVERDINWMRLRDLTIGYTIPTKLLSKQNAIKEASVFINGTDLFLLTNYSGADPYVSTTNPATGGAGGFGMDFGKTSLPRTFSMGLNVTF